ncbi:DUF4126 family protein [Spirosoma taeanense]|uniref:DUF4126 family protein n=1 Tax=Spirosoma taeanense TaxID=2735870 RepID=A0A6M5Y951_9BACT|nr:DUF4126 family protein [Spirosoma taeanense]QJW89906.1 DUF4126 family protein [Spirosoma taeanense]
MIRTYFKAFQIGLIAGMRTLTAPALLSHKLVRTIPAKEPQKPIHWLAQPPVSMALKVLAGGEIIADKLPNAPNRTKAPLLITRIASGATCGAFVSEVEGQSSPLGAVAGGLGAVAATFLFFNLRQLLSDNLGLPDMVGALAEDALTISAGWSVVNHIDSRMQSA